MNLNKHSELEGRHARLSPSSYSWIRYDEDQLVERVRTSALARRGTELHQLAHDLIRLGVRLPDIEKTLNMYVNDVIGFRMTPEQTLFYSVNCFGTADACGFREVREIPTLKIFDLKTGEKESKVDQLLIYAALFCLEYGFRPFELDYDLRIYQNDTIAKFEVDPGDIAHIMDKIKTFDKIINEMYERGEA